jgi:hypothetical protein
MMRMLNVNLGYTKKDLMIIIVLKIEGDSFLICPLLFIMINQLKNIRPFYARKKAGYCLISSGLNSPA